MFKLLAFIGVLLLPIKPKEPKIIMWHILEESELGIAGTTNVNSYYCMSDNYFGDDKIYERYSSDGNISWSGKIKVPASSFDCANNIMTKDFQTTIKADQHPYIGMEFLHLEKVHGMGNVISGEAIVTLVQVHKKIKIDCEIQKTDDGVLKLEGSHSFLFSDFGLEAPRKFFGAIKVKDSVTVEFKLFLKSESSNNTKGNLL
ncbi:YceI family protein [Echinicola marina]|uniref:YceI family protein n=1 Tax=Echinicola marina TaxID=2859768 RepID=UPI001CF6A5E3|nr:YceI family protein [Echinicola marina]UCS93022.1 YceI family protein [Echinicola marina]